MQVTFWGTRGSIAKPGPRTVRFGGNTSCVEVRSEAGTLLLLDCGTGAHELGQVLSGRERPVDGHILISHTHWDHIQGLPFFAPMFQPESSWHLYGPRGVDASISHSLAGQMQYTYFPVTIQDFGATVEYHDLVEGTFEIGDIRVTTQYLNHPALTLGYRLEADGVTLVYSSDHEPHDRECAAGRSLSASRGDARHVAFLRDADLVIHDAQYLAEEYPAKLGWGHSTVEYAVEAARTAHVRSLALFHHDPNRNDDEVDALVLRAHALAAGSGYRGEVFAAAEGQTVRLTGRGGRRHQPRSQLATAMQTPALADHARTVLLAVHDCEIAATLRSAAHAESLELLEADNEEDALEISRAHVPGIVLLEDDPARSIDELIQAVRALDQPHREETAIVVVTAKAPPARRGAFTSVTDWLVWPSTAAHVRTKLRSWVLRRACRWQVAPLPSDEPQRLESLRRLGILDTEPEERFDRITELACSTFDVPIALVSLVDTDRQWFKSRQGISATETPRDTALCAHAILHDDILQVADALTDPRFAENPLVLGSPRVRFYAGVPLKLSDGSRVGTLCVIDHTPRTLDGQQLERLRQLGRLVEVELETHAPATRQRSTSTDHFTAKGPPDAPEQ